MSRRSTSRIAAPVGLAVLLVLGIAAPALACEREIGERAAQGAETTPAATTASAIIPGSVNRSSLNLSATYSVGLTLSYSSRWFSANTIAQITNTSGGPIDRVELNTIAARLGGMSLRAVSVDGKNVSGRISDQTVIVPLGGILPAGESCQGAGALPGPTAELAIGVELVVHQGQRHRRRVSLDPVGQSGDTVHPAEPRRPLRDAGQP